MFACGYRPRCALEISDSSENRLSKIEGIIRDSKFGIHDISFVDLDQKTKLPRFNMPFELGMFFAAKHFGSSDISGQDISVHKGIAKTAIRQIRDWLNTGRLARNSLPGGDHISAQYNKFSRQLPAASKKLKLNARELTYPDIVRAIEAWLKDNA